MKFYMMVGIPSSGKSTIAKEIAKQETAVIIATDDLREELFNDVNSQVDNDLVFRTAMQRVKQNLKNRNVILDATNINYKRRMSMLHELNYIKDLQKIAVLVATPYEECLQRNKMRDRKVPENVIKRMYYNIHIPKYYEGFDEIQIKYNSSYIFTFEDLQDMNQDNPYHTLTVKQHCDKVHKILDNKKPAFEETEINRAGLLHDIGKLKTKTFINNKGEKTDVAHYYNHEKVSAYDSLFNYTIKLWYVDGETDKILNTLNLIQWHMLPYSNMSEKTINKYKRLLGEKTWEDLMLLHEADKEAH